MNYRFDQLQVFFDENSRFTFLFVYNLTFFHYLYIYIHFFSFVNSFTLPHNISSCLFIIFHNTNRCATKALHLRTRILFTPTKTRASPRYPPCLPPKPTLDSENTAAVPLSFLNRRRRRRQRRRRRRKALARLYTFGSSSTVFRFHPLSISLSVRTLLAQLVLRVSSSVPIPVRRLFHPFPFRSSHHRQVHFIKQSFFPLSLLSSRLHIARFFSSDSNVRFPTFSPFEPWLTRNGDTWNRPDFWENLLFLFSRQTVNFGPRADRIESGPCPFPLVTRSLGHIGLYRHFLSLCRSWVGPSLSLVSPSACVCLSSRLCNRHPTV